MSILAKLFPGNDQVQELEASLQENDSIRAELVSSQERIAELEASIENHAIVSSDLVEAKSKIAEIESAVAAKDLEIVALKEAAELSEAKIAARASELLAQGGHPAPVALNDDTDVSENKLTRDQFNALDHIQRNEFIKNGGKIK